MLVEEGKEATYVCSDEDFVAELAYLKQKVDAGADFIMTQMFFDPAVFKSFVAACRTAGIHVPIVPGLMCIQAKRGFERMTTFCRSRVPADLRAAIAAAEDDDAVKKIGVAHGAATCNALREAGSPGYHFYTLNLEKVTLSILRKLGLFVEPIEGAAAAADGVTPPAPPTAATDEAQEEAAMNAGTTMGGADNVTH